VDPRLGLVAAAGVAFVLIALADLACGLVVFVVASFLDVVHFEGGSVPKLTGLLLIVSWMATLATREGDSRRFLMAHHGYAAALVLFLAWVALSALWAEDTGLVVNAVQRYAQNMLLLPIVFTAVRERRHAVWVLAAFVAGALASTVYGIAVPVAPVPGEVGRLGGAVGDSNETATVLVAAIVLAVALLGVARRSPLLSVAALGAATLALAGLVNTLSRAGLLAFGIMLLTASLLGGRWRRYITALAVLGVAATLGYFLVLGPPSALNRVQSTDSSGRTDLWTIAWRAAQDNPVRGLGAGNFQVSSVHYLVRPGATTRADFIVNTPKVVHNLYLEQLVDVGIVGLGLFTAILALSMGYTLAAARAFARLGDPRMEMVSRAVLIALVATLAADFFVSAQFSKQLWILLALGPALLAIAKDPWAARW
jgi:O-antigen ligase